VLVEAPRFSKFIHGMALLQYSKVQEAPSWFLSKEGGMPMPASIEEMWEMTAEKRAEKLDFMQVNVGCFFCNTWGCCWGGQLACECA
jgi:SPX domain protein involved in polyphosphate accumulation